MGRNLLDVFGGPLVGKGYLIVDRDTNTVLNFGKCLRGRVSR